MSRPRPSASWCAASSPCWARRCSCEAAAARRAWNPPTPPGAPCPTSARDSIAWASAWRRLKEAAPDRTLTVTVSPAFAAKWLLPRIERFQSRHPEIDLLLATSLRPVDLLAERVDIGVRYGAGRWPGLSAVKLMDEQVNPVCAPSRRGLRRPADLARSTLIHDLSMPARSGFPTWRTWLDEASLSHVSAAHGLRINNSAAVLQAAIDGMGVALGRSVMVRDDLAAGRLVRPFGERGVLPAQAYYAVYRAGSDARAPVAAFRDWLVEEAGALR